MCCLLHLLQSFGRRLTLAVSRSAALMGISKGLVVPSFWQTLTAQHNRTEQEAAGAEPHLYWYQVATS